MKEFEDMLSQIAWIGIAVLGALIVIRIALLWRSRHQRAPLRDAPARVRLTRLIAAVGLLMLGLGLIAYLFVLQRGSFLMPMGLKITLSALLLIWLALGIAAQLRPSSVQSRWRTVSHVAGLLASWAIGALLLTVFWSASRYPPADEGVLLRPPFEGEWVATGAGASGQTNHHHRIPSQRYAIDLAKACPDGRVFRGLGLELEASCTFGAVVLAPAAGVVVHVRDGLPDRDSRQELPGNHVIVRIAEDRYVALAHLQQDSITVAIGDEVQAGQAIARAGNSGNSDFPHLHIHVQDGPIYDLRSSVSIPFRFEHVQVRRYLRWRDKDDATVLSNDWIRPRAP